MTRLSSPRFSFLSFIAPLPLLPRLAAFSLTTVVMTACSVASPHATGGSQVQAANSGYTIYEHGKECADTMGVTVPTFTCDGPQSARLKIEVNGQEVFYTPNKCDKPAYVGGEAANGTDFSCTPGSRVSKFTQQNAAGQTVVTVVACRAVVPHDWNQGLFDNIGIIQSNLTTKDTCFFQIRGTVTARNLPPPYAYGRQRGDGNDRWAQSLYVDPVELGQSDPSGCYRCHDSQVWIRTPWIKSDNQVGAANGNDNEIPQAYGVPHHIGWPFQAWNNSLRPQQVKINRSTYDQTFPPQAWEASELAAGHMANSDTCTQCHAFGHSTEATNFQGSCNVFARYFTQEKTNDYYQTAPGGRTTDYANGFPHNAWMPPGAAQRFSNNNDYQHYYYRAFMAVQNCCDNPWANGCHQ